SPSGSRGALSVAPPRRRARPRSDGPGEGRAGRRRTPAARSRRTRLAPRRRPSIQGPRPLPRVGPRPGHQPGRLARQSAARRRRHEARALEGTCRCRADGTRRGAGLSRSGGAMAMTTPRTGGIAGETLRRPLPRGVALAHISDLHVGKSARTDRSVRALARSLIEQRVDHVVLTGDVTHGGRRREYDAFCRMFRTLSFGGRITLVPGNHDRLRQDVAARMSPGSRVWTVVREGLFLVCLDSTAPHNRSW